MKIIIVGCGKVGQKLAEQLNNEKNHDITVIDKSHRVVQDTTNMYDVMGVVGSGTSLDTLLDAGVREADILIAVTNSDELNLLTCFIAKKAGNCRTVARVRQPEYNKDINLFKNDFGLAMVINPEQAAADEITRVLCLPSAIQIDTFAKGRVEILKFRLKEDSVLNGMRLADISLRLKCDVLVCGVERGEDAFIPGGDFVLHGGDAVSIVASPKNATFFFKKIGIKTNKVKDTMIVGGGATSYYLANSLIQAGVDVKIIEKDAARCDKLCELLPKASIVNADGTENRVLLENGLEYVESFVALTNIDEENIMLSLFAKSRMNGKLVTKINRIAYDDVISSLDLDTVIHPKDITAEHIVKFVRAKKNSRGGEIETMHLILDGKAEALEFSVREDCQLAGKRIEDLPLKNNVLIACINRGGKVITPRGHDSIIMGDTVIIVTTHTGFRDIQDILDPRKRI